MSFTWIVEKREHSKFPYRITIKGDNTEELKLLSQDRWPGTRGSVFCIRDKEDSSDGFIEIERVNIISLKKFGKKVSVVLDRAREKRCDFLFLKKRYKDRNEYYEQIFFRTQKLISENRTKFKLSIYHPGNLNIVIDINERYPWVFSGCNVFREKLPAGDYALKNENSIIAVVERKTFENMISEFGNMEILHQKISELSAYKNSALVIEADYKDFLNPKKLKFYSPTFTAKAIGEIFAVHNKVSIVFCGSRKLANEWVYRYFYAIQSNINDKIDIPFVSDILLKYEKDNEKFDYISIKQKIKDAINDMMFFTLDDIKKKFPEVDTQTLRKIISDFKRKKIIISKSKGVYLKNELLS